MDEPSIGFARRHAEEAGLVERVEWPMYGASILHCLPAGMAEKPSAATGTVMRGTTLERYARLAGFAHVEVLPIEHSMFRFYLLRQEL